MSSSTEDLKLLFRAESETIKFVKNIDLNQDQKIFFETYLKSVDFDEEIETDEYVKHPINAFHLLQRTSNWIPKLQKTIPNIIFNIRSISFFVSIIIDKYFFPRYILGVLMQTTAWD